MFALAVNHHWRQHHPLIIVLLLLSHVMVAFLWDLHPLVQLAQFLFLLLWAAKERLIRALLPMLRIGLWFSLLFLVVNPLFSAQGSTFLWKGPILPYLGRLDLTVEELVYSLLGVIRLINIIIVSLMFQRFVDHDRFLLLFAKVAPRFVMTSVIAFRMFPFLSQEYARIKEIAYIRGIRPGGNRLRDKLSYHMLIIRPLLTSALEGSWMTAETLYARGFGSGRRSTYSPAPMNGQEKMGGMLAAIIFLFAIFARALSFGRFQFYPQFDWPDPFGDLLLIAGLGVVWVVPPLWLGRREER